LNSNTSQKYSNSQQFEDSASQSSLHNPSTPPLSSVSAIPKPAPPVTPSQNVKLNNSIPMNPQGTPLPPPRKTSAYNQPTLSKALPSLAGNNSKAVPGHKKNSTFSQFSRFDFYTLTQTFIEAFVYVYIDFWTLHTPIPENFDLDPKRIAIELEQNYHKLTGNPHKAQDPRMSSQPAKNGTAFDQLVKMNSQYVVESPLLERETVANAHLDILTNYFALYQDLTYTQHVRLDLTNLPPPPALLKATLARSPSTPHNETDPFDKHSVNASLNTNASPSLVASGTGNNPSRYNLDGTITTSPPKKQNKSQPDGHIDGKTGKLI
jgi:hypothetical protein